MGYALIAGLIIHTNRDLTYLEMAALCQDENLYFKGKTAGLCL